MTLIIDDIDQNDYRAKRDWEDIRATPLKIKQIGIPRILSSNGDYKELGFCAVCKTCGKRRGNHYTNGHCYARNTRDTGKWAYNGMFT